MRNVHFFSGAAGIGAAGNAGLAAVGAGAGYAASRDEN